MRTPSAFYSASVRGVILVSSLAGGTLACSDETSNPVPTSAYAYGSATTAGIPIVHRRITIDAYTPDCTRRRTGGGDGVTDENGKFYILMVAPDGELGLHCIKSAMASASGLDTTRSIDSARFSRGIPFDSVKVVLTRSAP